MKFTGIAIETTYIILNGAEKYSVGKSGVGIHYKNNRHPLYLWPTDEPRKPYVDIHGNLIIETKESPMALIKKLKKHE